jgi:hypothetical protein
MRQVLLSLLLLRGGMADGKNIFKAAGGVLLASEGKVKFIPDLAFTLEVSLDFPNLHLICRELLPGQS